MRIVRSLAFGALALAISGPAFAQWGPWGYGGYGRAGWDRPAWRGPTRSSHDDREGKVEVTRFRSQDADAAAFGHGQIAVQVTANAVKTDSPKGAFAAELPGVKATDAYGPADVSHDDRAADNDATYNDATYEAAVIDQMVKLGYDTTAPAPTGGQVVELTISRSVLEPAEAKHKPVSGEMDVGVSNRGSAVGGAIFLDFTKPAKALLSTRLEARIKDRATGKALWEGRADIATRDGDSKWTEQKIATRLAGALFGGFPGKSGETVILR